MPNPKPKRQTPADIKSLARGYSNLSLQTLGGIAKDGKQEAARVAASIALLDRGWGKPSQDTTHEVKGEIKVILRQMLEDEDE